MSDNSGSISSLYVGCPIFLGLAAKVLNFSGIRDRGIVLVNDLYPMVIASGISPTLDEDDRRVNIVMQHRPLGGVNDVETASLASLTGEESIQHPPNSLRAAQ